MRFALVPPVRFTFLTCDSRTPSEAAGANIYKALGMILPRFILIEIVVCARAVRIIEPSI